MDMSQPRAVPLATPAPLSQTKERKGTKEEKKETKEEKKTALVRATPRKNAYALFVDACIQTTKDLAYSAYVSSPVNFSSITGLRHPGTSIPVLKLPNSYGLGVLLPSSRSDGTGFAEVIEKAAQLAAKHPSGLCELWFGNKYALFVLNASDIQSLVHDHKKETEGFDAVGIYKKLFGDSILTVSTSDPIWKEDRPFFVTRLSPPDRYSKQFNAILKKHLNAIQENAIPDLEQFANYLAIDFISQTQLGFLTLSDEDKKALTGLVSEMLVEIANPLNVFLLQYTDKLQRTKKLNDLIDKGQALIKQLIEKNIDSILATDNVLVQKLGKDKTALTSLKGVQLAALILFAGYESTSKLLLFSLMLIADPQHKKILTTLREELAKVGDEKTEWTRELLAKVPMLDQIIREVLRLYPPFPIFKEQISGRFDFKGIPLYAGDTILFSPLITHRLATSHGDDATEFKLDRNLSEFDKLCKLMSFGFKERLCPGRFLSMFEGQLTLAAVVARFQELAIQLQHPYPVQPMFSLRFNAKTSLALGLEHKQENKKESVLTIKR